MIFVFGSNAKGHHAGGSAYFAYRNKGAVWGQGEGMQGKSYAIPTMEGFDSAKSAIRSFLEYATFSPNRKFQVTRIGCGIAGFTDADIAPLFVSAPKNCYFDETWQEWLPDHKFWGTF